MNFTEYEIGYQIQGLVDQYGIGMSKKELLKKVERYMLNDGHEVSTINDIWMIIDGQRFTFTKSRKEYRWIVKRA